MLPAVWTAPTVHADDQRKRRGEGRSLRRCRRSDLSAIGNAEFGHDPGDMVLRGTHSNSYDVTDFVIGQPVGEQGQHVAFGCGVHRLWRDRKPDGFAPDFALWIQDLAQDRGLPA